MVSFRVLATAVVAAVLCSSARAAAADRLCDPSFQNCRTPLLTLIQNERVGIDIGFWFMEDARYSMAIIDRWKAGVPVRIIMDSRANAKYPQNAALLKAFADAKIPMREKISAGIVHWKTMIFAGQHVVEFSGANFSPHAFVPTTPYQEYIDEAIFFTDDPSLVNSFKRRFDDVWTTTAGYRGYANSPATALRAYPLYTIDSRLNFPPYQDFAARSVKAYNAETTGIDAIIYRITDRRHTDALIAAKARGVTVRVISEPRSYRDPKYLWHSWNIDRMYMAGIRIRHRQHAGWLHQKTTVLRGQQLTIFGSSNWTTSSATRQLEHNIFSKDPSFFAFFTTMFGRKWLNGSGVAETVAFTPLPPDTPSYVSPANLAAGQPLTVTLKWRAGMWAHKYDIYFGTSPTPPRIASNVALGPSTSSSDYRTYKVGNLKSGMTYYWKIVSKTMANMPKSGKVFSFRTS
jgi:phosphatidylserine/phosphatidylglycerophosphate/cardiolipin synthase-like enzyme